MNYSKIPVRFAALSVALWISTHVFANDLQTFTPGGEQLRQFLGNGHWVVVKVWASDCHICNREAHQYQDFHEFNTDGDVAMVGISLDGSDQAAAKGFIDKHGITYPNLIMPFMAGANWYTLVTGERFIGTPSFLIYDRKGKLQAQQGGAVPTDLIEKFIAKRDAS
jgi:peroxiredoxin